MRDASAEELSGNLKKNKIIVKLKSEEMFDFEMVKELKVAAADNDVKSAFKDNISRERIGHEIDLMVSGNRPVKAIECISEFGLFWVVFNPNFEHLVSQEQDKTCVGYMDSAWILMNAKEGFTFSDVQRRLYLYAALFLSLRKTMYVCNKKQKIILG
ncbi:hypothetical protein Tco_0751544 [Tanacetum coccineum]|uniref:Uncharacterized protein n=1 Tax=Tanacetum coccineum TaxID=301880 RepID=A0ABQ4Z4C3_9ASTR